jgi:hypothetical protein
MDTNTKYSGYFKLHLVFKLRFYLFNVMAISVFDDNLSNQLKIKLFRGTPPTAITLVS